MVLFFTFGCIFHRDDFYLSELHSDGDKSATFSLCGNESRKLWLRSSLFYLSQLSTFMLLSGVYKASQCNVSNIIKWKRKFFNFYGNHQLMVPWIFLQAVGTIENVLIQQC